MHKRVTAAIAVGIGLAAALAGSAGSAEADRRDWTVTRVGQRDWTVTKIATEGGPAASPRPVTHRYPPPSWLVNPCRVGCDVRLPQPAPSPGP